jgi:uncharacterized protein (TIGR03435 family)
MKHRITFLAASCLLLLRAQTQPAQSNFDVVSIKPNKSAERNANWNSEFGVGGKFSGTNIPPKHLILTAYTLKESQLSGLPGWAEGEKYDIQAKAGKLENEDQVFEMLRGLLNERFQLKFHWVTKSQSVYALVIAKGGAKLKPSVKGSCVEPRADNAPLQPGEKTPDYCGTFVARRSQIDGHRIVISQLMTALGSQLDYPLIDHTGLKGAYDVHLTWNPDEATNDGADNSAGASIFTSLQEQLGLRLQSTKGPVKVLVIDHIEKPSEN